MAIANFSFRRIFWMASFLYPNGLVFTKAALLTFGRLRGFTLCLSRGCQSFWMAFPTQMIDGLALGETTPGPLIMVVAFVGF